MRNIAIATGVLVLLGCSGRVQDDLTIAKDELLLSAAVTTEEDDTDVERQSDDEALNQDLQLVAEAHGWSFEQAAMRHHAAEVVGRIAEAIFDRAPEVFAGSILGAEPDDAPSILIKGRATPLVRDLVASADIPVLISEGQPFSFDEMNTRKLRVHQALQDAGYQNFASWVAPDQGTLVQVSITPDAGLPNTSDEVLDIVPEDLRASTRVVFDDASANSE